MTESSTARMRALPRRRRGLAVVTSLMLLAGSWSGASWSATPTRPAAGSPAELAEQISTHIGSPRFAAADWGIAVVSLDTGRTLYAHRPDHLLLPASTAKLYTAALALSTVGASYRLPTQLMSNGTISQGVLKGAAGALRQRRSHPGHRGHQRQLGRPARRPAGCSRRAQGARQPDR